MEFIDDDIAKHIWGFFLEFDDGDDTIQPSHHPMRIPPNPNSDAKNNGGASTLITAGSSWKNNRRVDFQSIRSLRAVNKFFYRAFQDYQGWSRCALAIQREYKSLKNDEQSYDNWNLASWVQGSNPQPHNGGTDRRHHQRQHHAHDLSNQFLLLAWIMERKKVSVYRRNQLIQMLNRGPFTMDEKQPLLTYRKHLCRVVR